MGINWRKEAQVLDEWCNGKEKTLNIDQGRQRRPIYIENKDKRVFGGCSSGIFIVAGYFTGTGSGIDIIII